MTSDYRKARVLVEDMARAAADDGVWHSLFMEVEKVGRQ